FQECNYLQGNEATLDPLVIPVLQQILGRLDEPSGNGAFEPKLNVDPEETSFGLRLRASQIGDDGSAATQGRTFMMPSVCAMSGVGMDGYAIHWHVPIDDTH